MKNPFGKIIQLWRLITEGKFLAIFRYFILIVLIYNWLSIFIVITISPFCD